MSTYKGIWEPRYWLPSGVDWDDVKDVKWPVTSHLLYAIPVGFIMIIIRYFVERYILYPWARYIFERKNTKIVKNVTALNSDQELLLEEAYKLNKAKLTDGQNLSLAKKLDLEMRDIERWTRNRNKERSTELKVKKLAESGWRFLSYFVVVTGELYALRDKSWLWDIQECWSNYPYQDIGDDAWWFMIMMTGFYFSHLITLVYDVKRKDFWAMLIHHLVITCSSAFFWISNFVRIPMLIAPWFDVCDVFLEASKCFKYCKKENWAKYTFVAFFFIWIITRVIICPSYILKHLLKDRPDEVVEMISYKVIAMTVLSLFSLSVYWTYVISRVVFKTISTGQVDDDRSSDEDEG